MDDSSIEIFKAKLQNKNWEDIFQRSHDDPSRIFHDTLIEDFNETFKEKTVRISAKRRIREPRVTSGLRTPSTSLPKSINLYLACPRMIKDG